MTDMLFDTCQANLLSRPRMSALLAEAVKYPLTIVLAGAGYGKTRAVFEYVTKAEIPFTWLQFSERDNAGSRFWSKYVQLVAGTNEAFAAQCRTMGFPDTTDKRNRYFALRNRNIPQRHRLLIMDDIHLINHPDILLFLERRLHQAVKNTSVIIICREWPAIALTDLQVRGLIPNINEDDLAFTEGELAEYFSQQGLSVSKKDQREIMADTGGWAFSINLVARSLKRSPGYAGYVRIAMRQNIFKLMQTEAYDCLPERMRRFLARLSLIDHLSGDLVATLAKNDQGLLAELGRQNAYIRFDNGIHAYLIHNLFLDFLRTQTDILTREETEETYKAAADWCRQNGFEADALGYLAKVGDYGAIVAILYSMPIQMPLDIALCAAEIFERAPSVMADQIELFAVMHVRVFIRLGRWEDATELMRRYEKRFIDNRLRGRMLGMIYFCWGNVRALMSTIDGRYDFDAYYSKMAELLKEAPVKADKYADMPMGFWASLGGAARKGDPQAYIDAATRACRHIARCWGGSQAHGVLCQGELLYYQGAIRAAEPNFADAFRQARENGQFELEYKAAFYLMRVALWQGKLDKAGRALAEIEARQSESGYAHRYLNYDAAKGWHALALRQPDAVPSWLKEEFAPYGHAYYIENLGNQVKARCHYLTRNYPPLIAYIEGVKRRESVLYGRVELLALLACAFNQMEDRAAALSALREAYGEAAPNGIITPFIELGKDMRALATAALHEPGCGIPPEWLETIKRKSASFAKYQSLMIAEYKKALGGAPSVSLSAREGEVLSDLYRGLSRSEIAAKQALSINTVNAAVNNIFNKLGAHSIADLVRIAAEEKLV